MDSQRLSADIVAFANYLGSKKDTIERLLRELERNLIAIRELLFTVTAINHAQLPADVIKRYPEVRKNVSQCLHDLIGDEIFETRLITQSLEEVMINLKTKFSKVEQQAMKTKWNEVSFHVTSFIEITEWMERCWKHFYILNFNVLNAIKNLLCQNEPQDNSWCKDIMSFCERDKVYILKNAAIQALITINGYPPKLG